MASISAHKSGYRAQIFILGVRDSKVFRTKREALAWAGARETEIRDAERLPADERNTLGDLLKKYLEEVVPSHKGHARETDAIRMMQRELKDELNTPVGQAEPIIAGYRNRRLEKVKGATVLRELKILGAAFEEARSEWKWIKENPIRSLRKPGSSPHRDQTYTWPTIRAILKTMKYPRRKNAVALAFLLALRTGMRESEICDLVPDRIFEKRISLLETKTNPRDVPLSKKARRIVDMVLAQSRAKAGSDKVFRMKPATLSHLFARYRKRAGVEGMTFHDSRHTAATWMAKKVDVMTLCKIFGWTDPKMAMVYFNPKAADIADQLD